MSLSQILAPQSVALIGASDTKNSINASITQNLLNGPAALFFINPAHEKIYGQRCYKNIAEIEQPVDLAVISVPAKIVPDITEECGRAGVKGLLVISAGFSETGDEGLALEEQIRQICRRYGMRLIGPNCMGYINAGLGLNASFFNSMPKKGSIAFISQSGALGSAILDWAHNANIGFSFFISLGTMLDTDFGDIIDYLGHDPSTRSILIYMESVHNARSFLSAARGFARSKPILVLKPGRFEKSRRASFSHTGSLAGDDAVYEAAFRRSGILRVKSVAELFDAAAVLESRKLPGGPGLAVISNAGGPAIMTVDALIEIKGELAELSETTFSRLNEILPPYWSKANPVDILGDAGVERYRAALDLCLHDQNVHGVLVIYTPQGEARPEELAEAICQSAKSSYKPVIAAFVGGSQVQPGRDILSANTVPHYHTPEQAVRIYMLMYSYSRNLNLLYETPMPLSTVHEPATNNHKLVVQKKIRAEDYALSQDQAMRLLATYGLKTLRTILAENLEDALAAARETGYPVVLKINSPDISHKSDVHGVVTAIHSDDELALAFDSIMASVKQLQPKARISGVTVQKMLPDTGPELLLGAVKDRDFGTVMMFGMGGTLVELYRDYSIALPPLNQTLARRLINDTRVSALLAGYRGQQGIDSSLLEGIIVNFSNLLVDFPEIDEIDINPLTVVDGEAWVVDARISLDKNSTQNPHRYRHLSITPYPARYISSWTLKHGQEVLLRPIKPEDEPLEKEMLSTLSEHSIRGRFFSVIKEISHEMLTRFCNIDYDREMAIVCEITTGGKKRIIGIGRLILGFDTREAEYAVVVHDDFQGQGLGYKLVDVLIGIARDKHVETIIGLVLNENYGMLTICREMGFNIKKVDAQVTEVRLTIPPY